MMSTDLAESLVEHLTDLGYPVRSYSGRMMLGETCLGVVLPFKEGLALLVRIGQFLSENGYEAEDLGHTCVDDFGCDSIFYWPQVPFVALSKVEAEEEC